jgi:hypothetical protein
MTRSVSAWWYLTFVRSMNGHQTLQNTYEGDGPEPRSCCLEPVADAWKIPFMTTLSILIVIRRSWSKSRNVFWEQFRAAAACIVLLSWLPQGDSGAKRSMGSDTETTLRKRKGAISRGCLALVMVLASVSRAGSVWGLWHNLCVYRASEKDPPTTLPAKLGSSKNHPLRDTQLRRVLPQERPIAIFGGQRLSGLGPIFLLTNINLSTHFKRVRNEEIELGWGEVIYA